MDNNNLTSHIIIQHIQQEPGGSSHMLLFSYHPCCLEQHSSQQAMQPKHANEPRSCVIAIAHWSFIFEHIWMQHMQQHLSHSILQQLDAAITNISAASCFTVEPGGVFSAVAVRSPKPSPRFWSIITFCSLGSSVFCELK